MTRKHFERAVKEWQALLGLSHWDIAVSWTRDLVSGEGCSDDADATTWRSNDYDRAIIYFHPEKCAAWPDVYALRIVVHELLHLTTREVDRVFASLDGQMHPDAYRMVEKRYDHEIEGVVDRLATRLVELGS